MSEQEVSSPRINELSWGRSIYIGSRLYKKSLDFAVNGTAHHIGNESQATKTSGPTLVTCQSKCRSHLPPLIVILRFHTASVDSGMSPSYHLIGSSCGHNRQVH